MTIKHNLYTGAPEYYNDIALLKLKTPLQFTATIQPIGLPKGQWTSEKVTGVIAGWGVTSEGGEVCNKAV